MNTFLNAINVTTTENGAAALKSTGSAVLNLFSQGAAYRSRSDEEVLGLFKAAFTEDRGLALAVLNWIRDCRGGAGERRFYRVVLTWLGNNKPEIFKSKTFDKIVELGRFDDLFSLFGTEVEQLVLDYIVERFLRNVEIYEEDKSKVEICMKWMPSENTSSATTRKYARKIIEATGLTPRDYRKVNVKFRQQLQIVESKMSAQEWTEIRYPAVPSKAALIYNKAFMRNDEIRYREFLADVQTGKAKINAGQLFPYEIIKKVRTGNGDSNLNELWKALPNYFEGDSSRTLCVVDTSDSMTWVDKPMPLDIAISLGIYMAERNNGPFKDHFITFANRPELIEVTGEDIGQKFLKVHLARVEGSTNIQAVFDLILIRAITLGILQKEMPERIIIVSDMEFNQGARFVTSHEEIEAKYTAAGYKIPTIVYWNTAARNNHSPVAQNKQGVQLVSGASPAIITGILRNEDINPYSLMLEVVAVDRYTWV